MVKVFVVISGLALAEVGGQSPLTVHMLQTAGARTPELGHSMAKHKSKGTLLGAQFAPKDPYQISIKVKPPQGSGAMNDLGDSQWFPELGKLYRGDAGKVRNDCRFSADSLTKCLDDSGNRVLAGQIRLDGVWKLRAIDTEDEGSANGRDPMMPIMRYRSLARDSAYSTVHAFSGRAFANTFSIEASAVLYEDVEVTFPDGTTRKLATSDLSDKRICASYDATSAECFIIRIDHAKDCSAGTCVPHSGIWSTADLHFSQIYRLLNLYNYQTGEFETDLYVPFGDHHGSVSGGPGGPSGPRCYGGVAPQ